MHRALRERQVNPETKFLAPFQRLSLEKSDFSPAVWCTPIILALRRLRQEIHKFKVGLAYGVIPSLKERKERKGGRAGTQAHKTGLERWLSQENSGRP